MEGDHICERVNCQTSHFNPLPPHGGRQADTRNRQESRHFNPLPPHGGRPIRRAFAWQDLHFNPLPPHGGRPEDAEKAESKMSFQSTPSAWRETCQHICRAFRDAISIHSLRMEGDRKSVRRADGSQDFNPLPPHGGRQQVTDDRLSRNPISIHSLRMEGDCDFQAVTTRGGTFQSTPSAWRETDTQH